MSDQQTNALVALVVGLVVAVLLFIPVAAVQYRRDGRLGPIDLLVLVTAAVYAMSLWTYTLLPLPTGAVTRCLHAQTTPLTFIGDIRTAYPGVRAPGLVGAGRALLRDAPFMQVALNVVLFVPLGLFVRVIAHRGIVVATAIGLVVSLLIETTQRTGVWGVYGCAYRLFDVDDLIVNTTGALLGAAISWPITARRHRRRGVREALPTQISLGRRYVGFVADALFVALTGGGALVAYRVYESRIAHVTPPPFSPLQEALLWGVPLALEALVVLAAGCTVGELVIDLRTVPGSLVRRVVKVGAGIAPPLVLLWIGGQVAQLAAVAYVVMVLVAAVPTRNHGGLSHAASGLRLEIDTD